MEKQTSVDQISKELAEIKGLILSLSQKENNSKPQLDIGPVSMASEITGLAKQTIYQLVSAGLLPNMKKGKKLYFSRLELEKWVRDGKRKTIQEMSEEIHSQIAGRRGK